MVGFARDFRLAGRGDTDYATPYTRGLLEQNVLDLADPEHAPILTR